MRVKTKYNNTCECFLEVNIPAEVVNRTLEEVYKEIKKYAKISGFRPGSAPQDILEKHHGARAQEEMLKKIIPSAYRDAVNEQKINPVGLPEISDVRFTKDNDLFFKAKVEIRPVIKLKKYKGIKVKQSKVAVTDNEIEDSLKRLQQMHAQFQPIQDRKSVQKSDFAICDVEAFIEGKPITKKHENMWIEANKDASLLGIGEKLIGSNLGDTKEVELKLPENYPDKKYAGKDALFKVSIKELKEKKLPGIDDEFAKDLRSENLKTLKEDLKKQLLTKKEANSKIEMKNQILDKLLKDYKFTIPPSMAKRQFEILEKQLEEKLLSQGIHKDSVEEQKKGLEPKLREDADNKIKLYFILNAISEKENTTVTEEDIEERLQMIAQMSGQALDSVRQYYEKNHLIEGLWEQLKEEKTLELLLREAEINQI